MDYNFSTTTIKNFGMKHFVVWGKSGTIKYIKPTYCKHLIDHVKLLDADMKFIYKHLSANDKTVYTNTVELTDQEGTLYAIITKDVHIEHKHAYEARRENKQSKVSGCGLVIASNRLL